MEKLSYTIQCTDKTSGKVGSFVYDEHQRERDGFFTAISPVFDNFLDFLHWKRGIDCPFEDIGEYQLFQLKRKEGAN